MTETAEITKKLPNKWQERLNNEDNPEINEPISKITCEIRLYEQAYTNSSRQMKRKSQHKKENPSK